MYLRGRTSKISPLWVQGALHKPTFPCKLQCALIYFEGGGNVENNEDSTNNVPFHLVPPLSVPPELVTSRKKNKVVSHIQGLKRTLKTFLQTALYVKRLYIFSQTVTSTYCIIIPETGLSITMAGYCLEKMTELESRLYGIIPP